MLEGCLLRLKHIIFFSLGCCARVLIRIIVILLISIQYCSLISSVEASITVKEKKYIGLDEIADLWGMQIAWTQRDKVVQLKSYWSTLEFSAGKHDCTIRGIRVFLVGPAFLHKQWLYISEQDFLYTLSPIMTPQIFRDQVSGSYVSDKRKKHIVIDPGHGGRDRGAQSPSHKSKLEEKKLTLELAWTLKSILESTGHRVSLTRSCDEYIELVNRVRNANELRADLFISLHFNSAQNPNASGVETYALTLPLEKSTGKSVLPNADKKKFLGNRNNPWNLLLAYHVQEHMCKQLLAYDRGVKRARFKVLKDLKCPGVLIESGFLSNSQEAEIISTSSYRNRIAQAIADGIACYNDRVQEL